MSDEQDLTKEEAMQVIGEILDEAMEANDDKRMEALLMGMIGLGYARQDQIDKAAGALVIYLMGYGHAKGGTAG